MPRGRGARSTQRGPSRRSSAAGGSCFRRRRRRVEERGPVAQQQARSLRDTGSLHGGGGTGACTAHTHMRWCWGDRAAAAPVGARGSRAWLGTQPWSCASLEGLGNGRRGRRRRRRRRGGSPHLQITGRTARPLRRLYCECLAQVCRAERIPYYTLVLLAKRCLVRLQPCCGHTGPSEESRPETSSGFSRLHNGRWNARSTWRPANHMPSQHTSPLAALSCERTVGTL
jgi:hypothetical protein